jgi:hypothetical protein
MIRVSIDPTRTKISVIAPCDSNGSTLQKSPTRRHPHFGGEDASKRNETKAITSVDTKSP